MRIYLDTCCYNRPFDADDTGIVSLERAAIISIFKHAPEKGDIIIGSDILGQEINAVKNLSKRTELLDMYSLVDEKVNYSEEIADRARLLMISANIKFMDALHIAHAEAGNADYFLTTDYRLIKSCVRLVLNIKVLNPVDYYLMGGLKND